MLRILIIVVVLGAFAIVLSRLIARGSSAPSAGAPAPDFTLPSQDGVLLRLADYRGKWVVLYFYPKDQTPG